MHPKIQVDLVIKVPIGKRRPLFQSNIENVYLNFTRLVSNYKSSGTYAKETKLRFSNARYSYFCFLRFVL